MNGSFDTRNDPGSWKFDDTITPIFEDHAKKHIPHYLRVLEKSILIAETYFKKNKDVRIVDIGSATGKTIDMFISVGYSNVFGIESSLDMIKASKHSEKVHHSSTFPCNLEPFDFIIANWTLHFVSDRQMYLRDIFQNLNPDGLLLISDKMQSSKFIHDRYHDFKRSQGVTEEEIIAKERALQNVLVPLPLEWYLDVLDEIGFKDTEIIDADWCFKTLLTKK